MDDFKPIYSPHLKRALIIVNSNYSGHPTLSARLPVTQDAYNMQSLLSSLSFDTKLLLDCPVDEVTHVYTSFLYDEAVRISKLDPANFYGQFFIYYSGHGRMCNGVTYGVTQFNDDINLDKLVFDLAIRRNNTIMALFDCCRSI